MDADAIVVGAGPNGLFAACRLARAGLRVLVLEANDRPGGALWTEERTLPGYRHDVGAAFVAFKDSAAFRGLGLPVAWGHGEYESAHPAPDGTVAAIARDPDRSAACMGSPEDGDAWRRLAAFHRGIEPHMLAFLGTLPVVMPALRMGPIRGLVLLRAFLSSSGAFARRTFRTEAARRVIPAMGLHVDVAPEDPAGTPVCWMLALRASTAGFAVPLGGASAVTAALVADLRAHGGTLRTGAVVDRVVVRDGRAVAVRVGAEELAARAVLADTAAAALLLGMVGEDHLPRRVVRAMRAFPQGWGTFKLDLALDGPVPWVAGPCRTSAVVHAGDSLADLQRFADEVREGLLPERPYLVVGQQSLVDPSRAPVGRHALYVYTHVPARLDGARYPGGWPAWRERMADRIADRIEGLAPGFRARVLARAIADPDHLERAVSRNVVGGDLGGGSNRWNRQLVLRPVFPWFRYRMPVRGLYLCSSYAHPGAGIHGMCGWNAAEIALRDLTSSLSDIG